MALDISALTMAKIEIFLAAAASENFSAAAETLHVTQPLVSKTVSGLERELGFPLFVRENRRVRLTEAGRVLQGRFTELETYLRRSVELAEAARQGGAATLAIADSRDTDKRTYLLPILERFSAAYPRVQIRISLSDYGGSVPGVAGNSVDLAFSVSGELPRLHSDRLRYEHFHPVPACLCVGPDSPFYDRDSLELPELDGVPLLMLDRTENSNYNEYVTGLFADYGLKPLVHDSVSGTASLLHMIGRIPGVGVIANEYFDLHLRPETRAIPIRGTACELIVFYNGASPNPWVRPFLQTVRDFFADGA